MQSYFNYILYCSLSHSCGYFFTYHLSSAIVLAFVLFIISWFVLFSVDFPIFSSTCFFHLDLLMLSTFFILTPTSCEIYRTFEIIVFLWLPFVCSANIFLTTLLWSKFMMLWQSTIVLYCILWLAGPEPVSIIKAIYDVDIGKLNITFNALP